MRKYGDFKLFARYVSMNMLSMMALSCYFLADTYFIANGVGSDGIIALSIVLPIFNFVHGIGHMLGIGGATLFSIRRADDDRAGSRIFTEVFIVGIIISAVVMVLVMTMPYQVIKLLGGNDEIKDLAKTYLMIIIVYTPFFIVNNIVVAFLRNDNNPRLAMIAMIAASLSNVVLDYVFVYPMQLGMFGAGLATGLSPVISLIICSFHFVGKKNTFRLTACKLRAGDVGKSMSLGTQAFVGEISSGIVTLVFNMSMLKYVGNMGVAAYGIIVNIVLVVIAFFNGIGQGIQPILSSAYGVGAKDRIKRITVYAIVFAFIFGLIVIATGIIFDDGIIALFNKDGGETLGNLAVRGMDIYFIAFAVTGINIVLTFFYGSTNRPAEAMIISLARGFIGVLIFISVLPRIFDVDGIWATTPAVEFTTCLIAGIYTIFHFRKFYSKKSLSND